MTAAWTAAFEWCRGFTCRRIAQVVDDGTAESDAADDQRSSIFAACDSLACALRRRSPSASSIGVGPVLI